MDQAQISPGWALFAILILWGLAGALDEPIEDTWPPDVVNRAALPGRRHLNNRLTPLVLQPEMAGFSFGVPAPSW